MRIDDFNQKKYYKNFTTRDELKALHSLMDEIDKLTVIYDGKVSETIINYLNQARNQCAVEYRSVF